MFSHSVSSRFLARATRFARLIVPWPALYAVNYSAFAEQMSFTRVNIDVARPAASLLRRINEDVTLQMIRSAGRSTSLSPIRRQLIEGLLVHGCRTTAISRCLGVSSSLVSKVARGMRVPAARN